MTVVADASMSEERRELLSEEAEVWLKAFTAHPATEARGGDEDEGSDENGGENEDDAPPEDDPDSDSNTNPFNP
ncbi:hypothetical protein ACF06X_34345 [Streptomyces sp. NPDC015346]|uniref:hypothetical protein n=1 Tax=Streptomyces sp. NPDC015346 TaxID=3364954 RepID=UPI0036FD2737